MKESTTYEVTLPHKLNKFLIKKANHISQTPEDALLSMIQHAKEDPRADRWQLTLDLVNATRKVRKSQKLRVDRAQVSE